MKKTVLFVLFTISIFSYGFSQSLALADSSGPVVNNSTIYHYGHVSDAEILSYMFVKNTTSATIGVKVKKVEINLVSGSVNSFCWGLCFAPNVYISPDPININAHATDSTDFSGHYTPSGNEGVSTIRYVFFNTTNTSDSVCVNIIYDAYPDGIANQTTKNSLSGAYPNPANNTVNFDYSLNSVNDGSVVIRNLPGIVVKKANLKSTESKVSIFTGDLPEGIYFYSLEINGKSLSTKKLVIMH
jgi:hypothetical protein